VNIWRLIISGGLLRHSLSSTLMVINLQKDRDYFEGNSFDELYLKVDKLPGILCSVLKSSVRVRNGKNY